MNKLIVITLGMMASCSLLILTPASSYAFGRHNGNSRSSGYHSKHYGYK
jgi:hypothetical protein